MRHHYLTILSLIIIFGSPCLIIPGQAIGATLRVTTTNDVLNAANTACSLREAIINVNDGAATYPGCGEAPDPTLPDTIMLIDGKTYTVTIPGAEEDDGETGDFDITSDMTFTVEIDANGDGRKMAIIDGGGTATLDRVFHIHEGQPTTSVTMEYMTIQNGALFPVGSIDHGGGILVSGGAYKHSALTLRSSVVQNNVVSSEGEYASGGGIYVGQSSLVLFDSMILNNYAATTSGTALGGGIFVAPYAVTFQVTNSTIANNSAQAGDAASGGGIYISSPPFVSTAVSSTIKNSTISGNNSFGVSRSYGGGIYFPSLDEGDSQHTILNSTITGNIVSGGGTAEGGGFYSWATSPYAPNISSSIISGNKKMLFATPTSQEFDDCKTSGSFSSYGNNFISASATCTATLVAGSPPDITDKPFVQLLLGPLINNGGPTKTHALGAGSPAIDTGACFNSENPEPILEDQRGAIRTGACDIGAYEVSTGEFRCTDGYDNDNNGIIDTCF